MKRVWGVLLILLVASFASGQSIKTDSTASASAAWYTDSIYVSSVGIGATVTVYNRATTNGILMVAFNNDTAATSAHHWLYVWPATNQTVRVNGLKWVRTKPVSGSVAKYVLIQD